MPENEKRWYPEAALTADDMDAWYRPPVSRTASPAPVLEKDKKRRRTKIISLSVCAAILLCAAALAIWKLAGHDRSIPVAAAPAAVTDRGEYGSYREYFEAVYTASSDVALPRAEPDGRVSLTLYPTGRRELSLQDIYASVSPAVVGISAYRDGELFSWGSGVIFTDDGYIVTNTHILEGCDSAAASLPDGRIFEALLVGEDSASDIAVLKIDGQNLPFARFGDSGTLRVGDLAVAIGNPLGQEYSGTMTDGIISAINRNVYNNGHTMTLLQTNAALNEGSSGGPLVNAGGQVIGITNMKIMSAYFVTVEGIGFAIPSSVVKDIVDQIMANGYVPGYPSIGITAVGVSSDVMRMYGLPAGVYVAEVRDGSDAQRRGLQSGDIITQVNGVDVRSVSEVNAIKEGFDVGEVLTLTVYRDGTYLTMEVELVDSSAVG